MQKRCASLRSTARSFVDIGNALYSTLGTELDII
jgi:hypothetical protein